MPERNEGRPKEPTRRKVAGVFSVVIGAVLGIGAVVILVSEVVYKLGCVFGWIEHLHTDGGAAQCGAVWGIWRSMAATILLGLVSGVFLRGETSDIGRKTLGDLADWSGRVFGT